VHRTAAAVVTVSTLDRKCGVTAPRRAVLWQRNSARRSDGPTHPCVCRRGRGRGGVGAGGRRRARRSACGGEALHRAN